MESTYLTPEESPLEGEEFSQEELIEEEQELPEEGAPGGPERVRAAADSEPFDDPFFTKDYGEPKASGAYRQEEHSGEQQEEPADENNIGHAAIPEPSTEVVADWIVPQKGDPDRPEEHNANAGNSEPEDDRSASHKVDPLPPSEFRLFGMGGKKKRDDGTEHPEPAHAVESAAKQASGGTAEPFPPLRRDRAWWKKR